MKNEHNETSNELKICADGLRTAIADFESRRRARAKIKPGTAQARQFDNLEMSPARAAAVAWLVKSARTYAVHLKAVANAAHEIGRLWEPDENTALAKKVLSRLDAAAGDELIEWLASQ